MSKKKERRLLIDDCRSESDIYALGLPCRVDVIARNYEEGIKQLTSNGVWDVLYLDHDLCSFDESGKEFTGYDIMCWLENRIKCTPPKKIICVSSNPAGRKRIEQVIKKINE